MKRARKIPDWRFPAVPVYRDVHPDKIAVPLLDHDGSVITVSDLPADLVDAMEHAAQLAGKTFARWYTDQVQAVVERDLDAEGRGF